MKPFTALAMILLVGCNRQNEAVKVNVPDTVRVIDSSLTKIRLQQPLWRLLGDSIRVINGKEWRIVVEVRESEPDSIQVSKWVDPSGWYYTTPELTRYNVNDFYPDSLSACRALSERLERQRDELNEKINNIKCEGK